MRWWAAALAVLTACGSGAAGKKEADEPARSGADRAAEIEAVRRYRLTEGAVDRFFRAQLAITIASNSLSTAERDELTRRTTAVSSLEELARNIEGDSILGPAVRDAGLSSREYALLTGAIYQSSLALGMLRSRPNDDQDSMLRAMQVNAENVRFMREHLAEIERRIAEVEGSRSAPPPR